MSIIAVDPGIVNLGLWIGDITSGTEKPVTKLLGTFNVGEGPTYDAPLTFLEENTHLLEGVKAAIVETQEQSNIKARTVGTAIYGYLRGKGIKSHMSSSSLKNSIINRKGKQFSLPLMEKIKRTPGCDIARVKKHNYIANKTNSVIVAKKILEDCGDLSNLKKVTKSKKADDMCDALLLGVAFASKGISQKTDKEEHERRRNIVHVIV